jgi:hypothetical protein
MEAKNTSSKAKADRLKLIRARSAARRAAVIQSVQSEAALGKTDNESRASFVDEKSIRSLNTLKAYLGVGVGLSALMLIIQIWATLKAGLILTPVSIAYIFFSVGLITALVWCIKLLSQRRLLAMWVFIGIIAIRFTVTLAFRLYGGKGAFTVSDVVAYIIQAAILFEIYWLNRKGVLS